MNYSFSEWKRLREAFDTINDDPIEGLLDRRRFDTTKPLKNRGYMPRTSWRDSDSNEPQSPSVIDSDQLAIALKDQMPSPQVRQIVSLFKNQCPTLWLALANWSEIHGSSVEELLQRLNKQRFANGADALNQLVRIGQSLITNQLRNKV